MKRRKMYYVPGMISLIFLPILCVWYLNKNKSDFRVTEVIYAAKYKPHSSECFVRFDTSALSVRKNKRIYIEYKMTGENSDKLKLNSIEKQVVRMVNENDTTNGIHIIFDDNAKYETFINLIDILHKDSIMTRFLPFENNIWFLHFNLSIREKNNICRQMKLFDNNYLNTRFIEGDKVYTILHKPIKQTFIESIKSYLKLWPFFIVFILFSIISIRYITNNYIKTNQQDNNERFN